MEAKTRRGRPVGAAFPNSRTIRFRDEDMADAERLAERWRCSVAEAIRRALRETAKREKVG